MSVSPIRNGKQMNEPKSITSKYEGQSFTCTFDPLAPNGLQWVWQVDYVETTSLHGSTDSLSHATTIARRMIRRLLDHKYDMDRRSM